MQPRTLRRMKAETILCFYLVSSGVYLSIMNGLRKLCIPPCSTRIIHRLALLGEWHMQNKVHISTAIQSMQPQKPASSFRALLSHITHFRRARFQPRAWLVCGSSFLTKSGQKKRDAFSSYYDECCPKGCPEPSSERQADGAILQDGWNLGTSSCIPTHRKGRTTRSALWHSNWVNSSC